MRIVRIAISTALISVATSAFADDQVAVIRDNSLHPSGNFIALISVIITSFVGLFGIMYRFHRDRMADSNAAQGEAKKDSEALLSSVNSIRKDLDTRLKAVEEKTNLFWPRSDIEGQIEHQRNNRLQAEQIFLRRLDGHDLEIAAIKVNLGRVEQYQQDQSEGFKRLEQNIQNLEGIFSARFDRLTDILLGRSK